MIPEGGPNPAHPPGGERSDADSLQGGGPPALREDWLADAIRAARAGAWALDLRTGRLHATAEAAALCGLSTEAPLMQDHFLDAVHPEDRACVLEALDRVRRCGAPFRAEFRAAGPADPARWLCAQAEVRETPNGPRLIGLVQDITDSKLAETSVRESEARLSLALEAGHAGAWEFDVAMRTFRRSARHDAIFGYRHALPAWTYDTLLEHILPEDRAAVDHEFGRVLAGDTGWTFESRIRRPDGAVRWVRACGLRRQAPDGRDVVVGLIQDVTDLKSSDTQRRADEERLDLAKRAAGLGIHDYDVRSGAIRWDERVRELWGIEPDVPVTFDVFMAGIHPEDHVLVQAEVDRALDPDGGGRYYSEYRVRNLRDGLQRWIAATGTVHFQDRRAVRLTGTVQDITDRVRADELLRRNAESFRRLVDHSPFGVYIVDSEFRLARVSAGCRAVFSGIDPLIGRDFAEILRVVWAEPFASDAIARFRHTLETGEPYHAPDTTERRGNVDAVESYDWKIERITLPDGSPGVVCHFYDATRVRQAEQALREAHHLLGDKAKHLEHLVEERTGQLRASMERAVLAERMAAIGTFAAGLAHDIGNLLLPLSIRVDALLTAATTSDEVRRELAVIAALCDHLRQMATNLTLFARDPRQEGVQGRTALAAWSRRVRKFLDASVGPAIAVEWDLPDNLPDAAIAPHRLTQAVQNLIHNARDAIQARIGAGPSDGRIVIRARPAHASALTLCITDNGCGMSEEALRRCLEPFWTAKDGPDPARQSVGIGLGLSLAHQIIERAGGRMQIESSPGAGAAITLTLAVAQPMSDVLTETKPAAPEHARPGRPGRPGPSPT